MKIYEIIKEARADHPDVSYVSEPTKVTAFVSNDLSRKYTQLYNNLKRITDLSEELKALQEQVKQDRREQVMDLFDVEDAVFTRVIETKSVVLTLSKDPKATEAPKYKVILEELEKHLTPELITVLEVLKKEHVTVTQKEPSLRAEPKSTIDENISDNSVLSKISNWLPKFDRKLDAIHDQLGM